MDREKVIQAIEDAIINSEIGLIKFEVWNNDPVLPKVDHTVLDRNMKHIISDCNFDTLEDALISICQELNGASK